MTEILSRCVELLGPITIIAMLSSAYGTLSRLLASKAMTRTVLGALFGIVAALEMHAPIEPFSGVIVDLRNIPVALAGAFLGFRGLAICLVIAAACRLEIGGMGMAAGIAGLTIAGFSGFVWAQWQRHATAFSLRSGLLLAAMMSTHLASGVLLPTDAAIWFFLHAALPLFVANIVLVTAIAALIDREVRHLEARVILNAAAETDPASLLLKEEGLYQDIAHRRAAEGPQVVAGILAIRLNYVAWLSQTYGTEAVGVVLGAIRIRLAGRLQHARSLGITDDGVILAALSAQEFNAAEQLKPKVERLLTSQPVDFGHGDRARVSVRLAVSPLPLKGAALTTRDIAATSDATGPHRAKSLKRGLRQRLAGQPGSPAPNAIAERAEATALFAKADVLMDAKT